MSETSFRIYDQEGQPIDLRLKDITNIVVREERGTVRCGFDYYEMDVDQTKALADAWGIYLREEGKK